METIENIRNIDIVIIAIGIFSYIPLWIAIRKDNGASQSFLTWLLFCILDITQTLINLAAEKDYRMTLMYACTSGITAIMLSKTYKFELKNIILEIGLSIFKITKSIVSFKIPKITYSERIVISVIICLILWVMISAEFGLVFGVIAQMVAGFPLIKETYEDPKISAIPANIGFFTTNLLYVVSAQDRSWLNLIFCFSFVIFGIIVLFPLLRELKRQLNYKLFGD